MKGRVQCYSDEKNAQIVIALLKAHGIRRVIANPGTTNISFVGSVQNDPWFDVYSGVDERHSAYMAVGMSAECGEPVVLSCTGATASRNYMSALTEAYYRHIPILALTSMQKFDNIGNLSPQAIDRSQLPRDVVLRSFELRAVKDLHDEKACANKVNNAILELYRRGGGPVHINLELGGRLTFNTSQLPVCPMIRRFDVETVTSAPSLASFKRIALFVGSGKCERVWEEFAEHHNVVVFTDSTSEYRGPHAVHASLLMSQKGFGGNPLYEPLLPDLLIDIGEVSGDYPSIAGVAKAGVIWRVSKDGEIKLRFGRLDAVFEMPASCFVRHYNGQVSKRDAGFLREWREADNSLRSKLPSLPFSNPWIATRLARALPDGSLLNLGILNSLRSWNLFPAHPAVRTFANVGGFGIDGAVSTTVGSSLVGNALCFCVIGDLAFFYDMNALGNRHIRSNLRILVINNGCGCEFNMPGHPGSQFGIRTNDYIAAGGHFGAKSRMLVRHFAGDLGFKYLAAENKASFEDLIGEFVNPKSDKPIIFECFTEVDDEISAQSALCDINSYLPRRSVSGAIKSVMPPRVKRAIKELIR